MGGRDAQDKIYQAMRRLMTYRLGIKYSWTGARGVNTAFGELPFGRLLKDIFVEKEVCDEHTAVLWISEWLRRAGSRHKQVKTSTPEEMGSSEESGAEEDERIVKPKEKNHEVLENENDNGKIEDDDLEDDLEDS